MNQKSVARFEGKFDDAASMFAGSPQQHVKKIKAKSLLPENSPLLSNTAALFVSFRQKTYAVMLQQDVPEGAALVRNSAGQICGIPAVAGGSGIDDVGSAHPTKYVAVDADDGFVTSAHDTEEEAIDDMVDSQPEEENMHLYFDVYGLKGNIAEKIESGDHVSEHAVFENLDPLFSGTRALNPKDPRCEKTDNGEHEWVATLEREGGIAENPGVWGHGGGVIINDHCKHCDLERQTNTWESDHRGQPYKTVRYGEQ